jgi:uncharacterized protein (DUF111 family)
MKKKYFITINFNLCLGYVLDTPTHKRYINQLIKDNVVDNYQVSIESQKSFLTINAMDANGVDVILQQSPLWKYWKYEIDEIIDASTSRNELAELAQAICLN